MNIDHIGIAVYNLNEAVNIYQNLLNVDKTEYSEILEKEIKIALLKLENTSLEFLQPTSEESIIFKFLKKRGQGVHHLAFNVNNLEEKLESLEAQGFKITEPRISKGFKGKKVAFLHPKDACGALIELIEP